MPPTKTLRSLIPDVVPTGANLELGLGLGPEEINFE
jgi:hypothetical protein